MVPKAVTKTNGDGQRPVASWRNPGSANTSSSRLAVAWMRVRCLAGTDLLFAVILTGILHWLVIPPEVPVRVASDLYLAGITVLSIVFSLFFAAVAVVLTGADDGFILFLEEDGGYSRIVWAFRAALGILFFGLLAFLMAYARARFIADMGGKGAIEPRGMLLLLCWLFLWGLFGAVYAANDCLIFATTRAEHLAATAKDAGKRHRRSATKP